VLQHIPGLGTVIVTLNRLESLRHAG
jgi:hypothetical protein